MALCTLGNISSPETARDLFSEIEKLMNSTNSYIRKKVCRGINSVYYGNMFFPNRQHYVL